MSEETTAKRKPGRPPGSGSVAKLRREMETGGKLETLINAVYAQALAGDIPAAKLILDRIVPPLRHQAETANFPLPAGSLTEKAIALLEGAAAGDLPPDVAAELICAIGAVVAIEEGDRLRRQLDELTFGDLA